MIAVRLKRLDRGHYRHEDSGIEITRRYRGLGGGRFVDEWVVKEPRGDQWNWITTVGSYQAARAAVADHLAAV
jgi:hypothetical protein